MGGEVLKLNFNAIKTYFLEIYACYTILSFLMNIHEADSHQEVFLFSQPSSFLILLLLVKINTNITTLSWPEIELILFNWPARKYSFAIKNVI